MIKRFPEINERSLLIDDLIKIAEEKNQKLAKSLYESMSSEFNKPAQVKARHILLPVKEGEGDKEQKTKIEAFWSYYY